MRIAGFLKFLFTVCTKSPQKVIVSIYHSDRSGYFMGKRTEKILCYSAIIILAAQLSMDLFIADFKISTAVIFIPVFFVLTEAFPLIPVTFCSAFGVFVLRAAAYWFRSGNLLRSIASSFPETGFYICYGLLLYLYIHWLKSRSPSQKFSTLPLILIDYAANFTELFLRMRMDAFTFKTQSGIFLIACLRTLIIWGILTIFDRYKFLLLQKEHEDRYKRLLLLISKLDGEMMWMRKNTALIEDTMKTSYQLFEKLKTADAAPELSSSALSVAKDIHEIKKEYLLILRGISEALDQELKSDGMYLEEMFSLLKDSMMQTAGEQKKEFSLTIRCADNFYTDKHYALMSIFRNLFNNAVEAVQEKTVTISVVQSSDPQAYCFEVEDEGPGIREEYIDEVFDAGFSTKINYTTGEVNRGLGLNLVKDLVENQLQGKIWLASRPGRTVFTIRIPREKLEKRAETE